MKKKRVMLVHNNMDMIQEADAYFQENGCFALSDYALDGQSFLNKKNLNTYDIVLVKNALTHITGLYALENLLERTKDIPEHIILFTPFINNFILNKCDQLGIHCMNETRVEIQKLPELFVELDIKKECRNKHYFDNQLEIIRLLKDIGMLRTYIGYTYFEYVLNLMLEKADYIYKPMRTLYQLIADHFHVTKESVEKAMRSCVKSSFIRNDSYYAKILFGFSSEKKEFPSTSIVLQVCIKTLKEQKNIIINNSFKKSVRKI